MDSARGVITTPLRAFAALVVTGLAVAVNLYPGHGHKLIPTAEIRRVAFSFRLIVALMGVWLLWLIVRIALAAIRTEEKIIWLALAADGILAFISILSSTPHTYLNVVHIGLYFCAFLSAARLFALVCRQQGGAVKAPQDS